MEWLWADSFCIVQDDEDDKSKELAKMPRIYNMAVVTIAAARASGAKDGFLPRAPGDWAKTVHQIPFITSSRQTGSVYLDPDVDVSPAPREPTDSRAWTLQETYLSKRIVRYGSNATKFTC
ncbi:hypothetical protein K458DRAFT_429359 [Lentithecium fluviatile CBS 122367]|uniref:Heterokaryon incompatibility domain-containing protein n=1 Tax=Lentithecium fluviatile CBS 122367 TaxID=1168545 RepID=A0A6G1JBC2_9PLEO|nr:hypothetical protein K458DRAFT_429359 [Lentithecium fluviatile CBS 122367]